MLKKLLKKEEGFTIIEVVLVLAIAGLIFLIVFLALPQLQKSRRDTQRKNDAGRALAALESYSGNNNGDYPAANATSWNNFVSAYITSGGSAWGDPETNTYTFEGTAPTAASNSLSAGEMYYGTGVVCSGQYPTTSGANSRNIAVVAFEESGGTYCQDNR